MRPSTSYSTRETTEQQIDLDIFHELDPLGELVRERDDNILDD